MVTEQSGADFQFDFSRRRVLVAGGTGGIGAAVAAAYRRAGADVWVSGTHPGPRYDSATHQPIANYRQLDISCSQQVDRFAREFERLDVLVNCVGVALSSSQGDEFDPDVFDSALRVNLAGFYRLAAALRAPLSRSGAASGGCIIAVASLTSFFGQAQVPGYGAAKAGLVQLCKTLAIAWAAQGIRVNAIAPGLTETAMTAAHIGDAEALAPLLQRTPLRRVGQPSDMVGPVLFLSSQAAAYITGQTLVVDGGYSIQG
ncbi:MULTISPECIES: SDR family NAD(P)-dependent oxidoreductase [unclassified Pseudomonas]|uniref:SDR family NAD(P)-dependent oxidoreductase n=1 Tax=unclassified Pseudomonas TaxID=196821 RepID=UPI000A1D69C9|nr:MULTISPECIES: SDR family oxidoreductase [unclassified Pseudomonas]